MIDRIFDPEAWRQILQSDFNRGYIAALALVLALLLALLILKFLCWLAFRTRRCSEIIVPRRDGDIVISRDAVTIAVSRELKAFPELDVRRIRLFRRGKIYLMTLFCTYNGGSGIPSLADGLKPRLLNALKDTFGIDSLKRIKVVVEKLDETAMEKRPTAEVPRPETADRPAEETAPDGQ